MNCLNDEHIKYIYQDLHYRGIIKDELTHELVDHICSMVEEKMASGEKFYEAYQSSLKQFGHTKGMRRLQQMDFTEENKLNTAMISNYFKIAIRNIQKNRLYSFINIFGLAVGIACCLLISLYIVDELSYDRHHQDSDRIYRIKNEISFNGNNFKLATVSAPMADAISREFPEVEAVVRFRQKGSYLVKRDVENIKEEDVVFADPSVFKVFTIPLIAGDPATALEGTNNLVISEDLAGKLFPDGNALNQTLILDNKDAYKVAGVFKDIPENSHFHFNMIVSMEGLEESKSDHWLSNNFNTYIKLREGADPVAFQEKMEEEIVMKYISPQVQQYMTKDIESFRKAGNKIEYTLQPLEDIHLHSNLVAELEPNGNITYVYLFSAIALFLLVIACINFMNLSTARSASRAKEVGIRKVLGSFRSYLIRQFLAESTLLCAIAFIFGLAIAQIMLPVFNDLSGKSLSLPIFSLTFWGLILFAILFTGFMAGVYPAFFLSSFKPSRVLMSNKSRAGNSAFIRSTLVVFQFCISIILITGTVVVYKQLNFIQQKNLGFDREQVLVVRDTYGLGSNLEPFKNSVLQLSGIRSATVSGYLPASSNNWNDNSFWVKGMEPSQDNMVSMQFWKIDHDYIPTLEMKIIDGRNFSKDFPSDSTGIIINEAAVKAYGLTDPVGKEIRTFAYDYEKGEIMRDQYLDYTIVGIVEDFNYRSLKDKVAPLGFHLGRSTSLVAFRYEAANTQQILHDVESKWNEMSNGQPFLYSFMDQDFENIYKTEMRLGKIFTIFSVLTILIACLGLFALSSFTAEQRIKEIGIRKVLGASVSGIMLLFTKDFSKLILLSILIAVPVAYYGVNLWLENYTYKTDINPLIYLGAGLITLFIALLTMSFQSFKAAVSDPVDSLKSE